MTQIDPDPEPQSRDGRPREIREAPAPETRRQQKRTRNIFIGVVDPIPTQTIGLSRHDSA